MTTHYQKIQALGERMASNLETMGVSASFSDGGLTLADKILQIQRFNSGLMVYADKDIAQSGNTVNISALLMKNGKAVSGERVILKGLNSEVTVGSTDVSINTDYMITLNTEATFSIRDSNNVYVIFMYYNNSWQIKIGSGSFTPIGDGVVFIESGAVKYYDSNNVLQTVSDFTGAVMNSSNGANNTAYPIWVGTTGSDGVVSKSYTCSGAGLLNITAESGTLQSEPYSILDAIYYDTGISGTASDIWYNQQNAVNTRGDTYSEVTENGGTAILRLKSTNSIDKTNICVEFDVWQDGSTSNNFMSFVNTTMGTYTGTYNLGNLNLQTETWNHIKLEIDNNGVVTPNGMTSAQKTLSVNTDKMLFCFLTNGDITKIRFKDWRVYPI